MSNTEIKASRSAFVYVISSSLKHVVSFISVIVFTRILDTSQYGTLSVYTSWVNIFMVIVTLNLWSGFFNNGMIDFPDKRDDFVLSLVEYIGTVTILLSIVFFIFNSKIANMLEISTSLLYLMPFYIFFSAVIRLWTSHMRYEYKAKKILFVNFINAVANPIFAVIAILLFSEYPVTAKAYGNAVMTIILGIIFVYKYITKSKKKFNTIYWKYALKYNLPLVPHTLALSVLSQLDKVMIVKFSNASDVAVYSVAISLAAVSNVFFSALTNAFTPYTYQSLKEGKVEDFNQLINKITLLISVLTMGLILIIPEVISIISPSSYQMAKYAAPLVLLGMYFTFYSGMVGLIQFYYKKVILILAGTCIAAILNLVLNWIFIPKYGFIAAAYTTCFSYLTVLLINMVIARRIEKRKYFDFRFITYASLLLCVLTAIIMFSYSGYVVRGIILLIMIFAFVIKRKEILDNFGKYFTIKRS